MRSWARRAQVGRPRVLWLDDQETLEGVEIVVDGAAGEGLVGIGVSGEAGGAGFGGDVSGHRDQQSAEPLRVTSGSGVGSFESREIDFADVGEVVVAGLERGGAVEVELERPTASHDQFGDAAHGQTGIGGALRVPVEQRREGDLAGRVPGFVQRHRSHRESGEPAGAGVASHVVVRNGGAGEDELARFATTVDLCADVVPHRVSMRAATHRSVGVSDRRG